MLASVSTTLIWIDVASVMRGPRVRGHEPVPRLILASSLAAAALLCSRPIRAMEPAGGELQVNTYTPYGQYDPQVAPLGNGGFVVVWHSRFQNVSAQMFAPDGSRSGGELLVASGFSYLGDQPRFTAAGNGDSGFVVAWRNAQAVDGLSDDYGVVARRYAANGSPIGDDIQVNTYTTSWQRRPEITKTGDGFVVVWPSAYQDGSYDGVFGQRFSAEGTVLGTEFAVNSYTTGEQGGPAMAANGDGRFVVVWTSYPVPNEEAAGQDGSFAGIFAQRYAADGAPDGTEFQVNDYTTGLQLGPDMAMAEDGTFLVVWYGAKFAGAEDEGIDVSARLFGSDGEPLGPEFVVNDFTAAVEERPNVGVTADGDFLVAWQTGNGCPFYDLLCKAEKGFNENVVARKLSATALDGGDILVNTYTPGDQQKAAVAGLRGGGFIVAWQSGGPNPNFSGPDDSGDGISAQLLAEGACGDAFADGALSASDALVTLQSAVGSKGCASCMCDVNGDAVVSATDALIVLRAAVGQSVELACAPC